MASSVVQFIFGGILQSNGNGETGPSPDLGICPAPHLTFFQKVFLSNGFSLMCFSLLLIGCVGEWLYRQKAPPPTSNDGDAASSLQISLLGHDHLAIPEAPPEQIKSEPTSFDQERLKPSQVCNGK